MRRYPIPMLLTRARAATALGIVAVLAQAPAIAVSAAERAPVATAPIAAPPPLRAPEERGRQRGRQRGRRQADIPPSVASATAPSPAGATPAGGAPPGADKEFNWCHKVPPGQRTVKVNLKPDAELGEVVGWISSITCKSFVLSAAVTTGGKKVTIVAPALITPEEAFRVFLDALDSAGLTVQPDGKFLKIIEAAKAKSGSIPLYGWDGRPLSAR